MLEHAGGRRLAVLVNDFGQVNVDEALIASRSDDVIALANGCVCCTLGGELASTLIRISTRDPRPDYLVIESSGVSDPAKIAQIGLLDKAYELDSVIVTVDAEQVEQQVRDRYVGDMVAQQIRGAHLVLLNKTDLVDPPTRDRCLGLLKDLGGRQKVIETVNGAMAPELFFADFPVPGRAPGFIDLGGKSSFPQFDSFCLETGDFASLEQLEDTLGRLPESVLRAKGIVYLDDDARTSFSVHVVGRRMTVRPFPSAVSGVRSSLVFIGVRRNLDRGMIETALGIPL
jgi:G3E family GTPase